MEEKDYPTIVTKEEDLEKTLHPAMGYYDNGHEEIYYFGLNMEVNKWKIINKGQKNEKKVKVKEKELVLVHNNNYKSRAEALDMGYKINGQLLMLEPRWSLPYIKKYLDDDPTIKLNLRELFFKIKEQYEKYIDFPNQNSYIFFPIWDIGTYFHHLFYSFPYIHLHGLKNTAKSKVMTLSSNITFNALLCTGMTNATLFRIIENNKPTLYIDEFELVEKRKETKEDKDFETMLNNGYRKGLFVPRMEREKNGWKVILFQVYCPKMIANISGLRGALPSRCIKFVMHRAKKEDKRGDLWPKSDLPIWDRIRANIYTYALIDWKQIHLYYTTLEKEIDISNRDYELWKPILAIAKAIGDDIYDIIKKFALEKVSEGEFDDELSESWDYKLIAVLDRIVEEDRFYYVKEIEEDLKKEFIERVMVDKEGIEIPIYKKNKPTPEWIGRTLKKLSFTNHRRDGQGTQYFLSKKIVTDLIGRLQIKSLMEGRQEKLSTLPKKEEEKVE